jgi:hypothetical protein
MKTTAWACMCLHGYPHPFIHDASIRSARAEAQSILGEAWAHDDETARQGWKRAYKAGWRCIRVEVSALSSQEGSK